MSVRFRDVDGTLVRLNPRTLEYDPTGFGVRGWGGVPWISEGDFAIRVADESVLTEVEPDRFAYDPPLTEELARFLAALVSRAAENAG